MVRVRIQSVDGRAAKRLLERYATAADRAAAACHRRALRARQTLVGRALIRRLLEAATGCRGELWIIARGVNGRPFAVDAAGRSGPDISIAHSGKWVACGLAQAGRIGVDIETPRAGRRFHDIAGSVFSLAEVAAVDAGGQAAFLDFWTMREAIGKGLGDGVGSAVAMDGASLIVARNSSALVEFGGRSWRITHRRRHGFSVAQAWSST